MIYSGNTDLAGKLLHNSIHIFLQSRLLEHAPGLINLERILIWY